MKQYFYEKITIVVLMVFLFGGVLILLFKDQKPCAEIIIEKNGLEEKLTLKQIEKRNIENQKININKARIDELILIPCVGKVVASRISEYRNVHGDFRAKEELLRVEGIGENKLTKMEEYIKLQ
ncbi:MAG: helix-hairpin-helix domain-containing protein [Candidatus Omnitrophota bacterium]|nr:helix-hairpin-helix domain-containing protein [Candidatus Omnitrophota bacterium]